MVTEHKGENPKYRIGAVTRLTGLSADVVRVWERRYGAIRPQRSEGGSRLYSDADVARLRRLRQAVEKGHSIGQVARLSEDDLDQIVSDARRADVPDPYKASRERFLEAIERLDVVGADLELSRAATLYPPRPLVKNIVAPILYEVGERWAHREMGVAQEHVSSWLLRNLLSSLFRLYPPTDSAETIVLATPAGERHEFGILLAALLAATRGWRVVYVGADVPAADVAHAVRLSKSKLLALSVVNAGTAETMAELEAIAAQLPAPTRVWVGGREAINLREFLDRVDWILIRDLDDLDDRLRR
jgi:DNA-binding transcriptional MerR regulator/methylmalonyl-CoA mutase cobalamin-binding subunit